VIDLAEIKKLPDRKTNVQEVQEYVEKIKDPLVFLRGCQRFHEIERRDVVYQSSRTVVSKNPGNENYVLAGARPFLEIWNRVYLLRRPREIRERLGDDILEAFEKTSSYFEKLKKEELKLEKVDLGNFEIAEAIRNIFQIFSEKRSIGSTGASKVIHLIYPELFMMWDNSIRSAYHRIHPSYHRKSEDVASCYIEFMKNCKDIAASISSRIDMKELWKEHLNRLEEKTRRYLQTFPPETLPKMIDECNYVRWFKKEKFY
jgi:hypothetical protein